MYERNIKMKLYKKVITATKKIKMIHISQKQGGRNEINLESDQCILSQKQSKVRISSSETNRVPRASFFRTPNNGNHEGRDQYCMENVLRASRKTSATQLRQPWQHWAVH
ncbi:uncharacterized protein LOC124777458 isoform X2 [Schistocerca piceifrons]|uniref:uncharacterized protein LOC124777458 isoform X2 n=1 Tax=Schistocerca piceifrons TaxID=274613 RepID=UPI001F5FCDF7|nr:uncharacterized protein LOC124777458 isoform X2 [Schistocerca piceifrons]